MTAQDTQAQKPSSPRAEVVPPQKALFPETSAAATPATPADEGALAVPAVRARRDPKTPKQNARWSFLWRYVLPVLALLYLGAMAYRRSAPVVRVVTVWAQSVNPQH